MGRIYDDLRVNGDRLHMLFDSGAVRSYLTHGAARKAGLSAEKLASPLSVAIGGRRRRLTHCISFDARLKGRPVRLLTYVLDSLGKDEDGRPIDGLVGATAMEEYNIRLNMRARELDLTRFRRDFVEFSEPANFSDSAST